MNNLLSKLRGERAALPAAPPLRNILLAGLGGFVAISAVALLGKSLACMLVLGSFGASCVLVFGFPNVPFSQPRNVLFGHVFSSFTGLLCLNLFGNTWWAMALAVGLAIAGMMWTRTVHPPAGSNPVIVFLTHPSWSFLLFPTLMGALVVVMVALLYNNVTRHERYPQYW